MSNPIFFFELMTLSTNFESLKAFFVVWYCRGYCTNEINWETTEILYIRCDSLLQGKFQCLNCRMSLKLNKNQDFCNKPPWYYCNGKKKLCKFYNVLNATASRDLIWHERGLHNHNIRIRNTKLFTNSRYYYMQTFLDLKFEHTKLRIFRWILSGQ